MAADYHVTVQDVGVCTLRLHGVCRYLRNLMAAGAHSFFAFIFNLKACITALYPPPHILRVRQTIISFPAPCAGTACRSRTQSYHSVFTMKILSTCLLLALTMIASGAKAQNIALKSNLLYDAALSPNLGIEVGLTSRWSLELSGHFNNWTVGDGHRWKHWMLQPEARYWFCERFGGHFIAVNAIGGEYNFGRLGWHDFLGSDFSNLRNRRYQGWAAGAGVGYGYTWMLSRHWNLEAEAAVGWIYTRYESYPCASCGSKLESGRVHNYVGPTKLALNIVYLF